MTAPARDTSIWALAGAGALTGVVLAALAFGSYRLAPWGCDNSAWACLLPISMLGIAPVAAIGLPVALLLNRRRRRPSPDGWLAVIPASGLAAQLLVTGWSLWTLKPYLLRHFLFEALIFPQAFVAGAIAGAVFCAWHRLLRRTPR